MHRLAAGFCTIGIAMACLGLAGCGSDTNSATLNTGTERGTLIYDPPFRIASVNAAYLASALAAIPQGPGLLQLTGAPVCGVDSYHIEYNTVGGAGETTTASGALMVPTGSAAGCSGPRPIVLFAHGVTADKNFNLADISDPNNLQGVIMAAMFVAQGFIVVAPNYAGYDTSSLPYHPFLNADQNSKEMIDALAAARTALPHTMAAATSDDGKLLIMGFSEGGYVAMATHRALQAAGVTVTASVPISGPYAVEAMFDAVFYGTVPLGSTWFTPLLVTSYQKSYGNVYTTPTQVFEAKYAAGIEDLLPSTTPLSMLYAAGKLPQLALFNSTTPKTGNAALDAALAIPSSPPFAALGFGPDNLVTNDYRVSYVLDAVANPDGAIPTPQPGVPVATASQHPLRQDVQKNDLRNWAPHAPTLLCGGGQDPSVFFSVNTGTMQVFWQGLPAGLLTVLDVNATPNPASPFAPLQVAFQTQLAQQLATEGQAAVYASYHGAVFPFCAAAARGFFSQVLAGG